MSWHDRRYTDAHWDHERDLRKHEPRPTDQRYAAACLIGYCEGVLASGVLSQEMELALRTHVAHALTAFEMPSKAEREAANA